MRFGVEEEFCFINLKDHGLENSIFEFLPLIPDNIRDSKVKPDLHECILEVSTDVCTNLEELEEQLISLRNTVTEKAEWLGLSLISTGIHPFSPSESATLIETDRYIRLIDGGALLSEGVHFGMHIHIEEELRDRMFGMISRLKYFIPEIIALSVNSPYYLGVRTGFASSRLYRYGRTPTVGIPPNIGDYDDFERYIQKMSVYGIREGRDIYWDIRPRMRFGTVEVRVMDSQATVWQTLGVSQFILQLYRHIKRNYDGDISISLPTRAELYYNRYQAMRDGMEAVFQVRGGVISARERISGIAEVIKNDGFTGKKASGSLDRLIDGETGERFQIDAGDAYEATETLSDVFLEV